MAIETLDGNIVIDNGVKRPNRINMGFGIKLFEGSPLPAQSEVEEKLAIVTAEDLREKLHIWRPEETLQAADIFFNQGRLLIEGSPQNGKGTILFGLSDICDIFGWGYYFIDGHFCNSPAQPVVNTINEASTRRFCVFYDSFDYLFAKSAKMRKLSLEAQAARTRAIVEVVGESKIPVALTEHDDPWKDVFLNLDLRSRYSNLFDGIPRYVIPQEMQSRQSIVRFMLDHDIDPDNAQLFANPEENPFLMSTLTNQLGDKAKIDLFLESTREYPVLKRLVRFFNGDFNRALSQIREEQPEAVRILSQMVLDAEYEKIFLALIRK